MTQPRILLITRNLPPLVGGMERLNWHMADELAKYAQIKVIGPTGSAALKPEKVSVTEAPLKPLPLFLLTAFFKGLRTTLRWKPDVILAGSGLTAPIAWLLSKLCRAKSAAYLHGFDITVKDRLYQSLWVPVFKKMDSIIVNSTPTKRLAFAAGVPERKTHIVYPGVSLPDAPQPAASISAFKEQHGLTGKKVLLSVGRLTTRKGLKEFVEQALPSIVQAEPDAMLVVVGEAPKNSLGAGIQTVESIQAQAEKSGVAKHIKFLGVITDQKLLATAYEAADVHVFPVRHIPDDPEGFGMVAIEAAAHGLPTVAFATGGIVDAVQQGESGYLVEKDNYAELTQVVLELLRKPMATESIEGFARGFAWVHFGEGISNALIGSVRGQTKMRGQPAVWFPAIRTNTGTDVFTERLVRGLQAKGIRAEITWLPLRAEYAPWSVPIPKPPEWATVAHVNTWLPPCFVPKHLPIVATIHHAVHHPDALSYKGWLRAAYHKYWVAPIERRVMRRAQCITTVSQFVAETAKQTLLDAPMQVIYNGVDTTRFVPGTRNRHPDEPFQLLYVGGWKTLKGVDLLTPIMQELGEGFELHYTGGPAAIRDKSGMPTNMHDIGRLESDTAVVAAMQEADALLLPSRSEGFGLVAAEAMACGLPVIAFRETCLEEIVEDGVTGSLLPLGNISAIAEAVRTMSKNSKSRQTMSIAARQHVTSKFEASAMLGAYIDAYLTVLRPNGSSNGHH